MNFLRNIQGESHNTQMIKKAYTAVASWVARLVEEHMLVRRALLVWACALITVTLMQFWTHLERIQSHHMAMPLAIIGLLATAIGFYVKRRHDDDSPS